MKNLMLVAAMFAGFSTFAADSVPKAVQRAAAARQKSDFRTVIVKPTNPNPCDGDYNIELQVKKANMNGPDAPVTYRWETVNVLGSDLEGNIMEVCYE